MVAVSLKKKTNWSIFNWIALITFIGALIWVGWRYASWTFQDYIVTNRRVMQVEGIVNKTSRDSSLEKINDAVLRQGLFGRLLNFGDLEVLTASETTVDQFKMLNHVPTAAPAGASADAGLAAVSDTGPAAGSVAAPPAPPGPSAAPPPMTPEEVTDTLHRLADLRDRGAISAAEYEAKKAELLGRL